MAEDNRTKISCLDRKLIGFEDVPAFMLAGWQSAIDLLAALVEVPVALIMKTDRAFLEVSVSSTNEINPYQAGGRAAWDGHYSQAVIQKQDKLVVADARKDAAWSTNPDVARGMVAYMGLPVNFPDGRPYGTICVLDRKARHFSGHEESVLQHFQHSVERDLQLLADEVRARQQYEALENVLSGMHVATWEWNVQTGEHVIDARWADLVGCSLAELAPVSIATSVSRVHPDDEARVQKVLAAYFSGASARFVCEYRLQHKAGHWLWVEDRGFLLSRTAEGQPLLMCGMLRDITEAVERRERDHFESCFRQQVVEFSSRFLKVTDASSFDAAIHAMLASFGQLLDMDRSYVFRFSADMLILSNTHEWCAPGIMPQIDTLQRVPAASMPWWTRQIQRLMPLQIEDVEALPEVVAAEKREFARQGIQSLICLPICDANKQLLGFLGFDAVRRRKIWPEAQLGFFQILADLIGSAFMRMATTDALSRSEKQYETLFREMLDGFALHEIICDADGAPVDYRFLAVNPAFERITGLAAAAVIGRTVQEVLPGTEMPWIGIYGKVALTGDPVLFDRYSPEMGKHLEVSAFSPAPGQFACLFQDITQRKTAQLELQKRYEELERINRVVVGREMRMIELKQEINALLQAAGQKEKYRITCDW